MPSDSLIIFDYSGTLSLKSTLFARAENLMKILKDSGLIDLGISSPDIFWKEIVYTTWQEASTTGVGYKKIMEERVASIMHQNMSIPSCVRIADAVSFFVDSYFKNSLIDPRWEPILRKTAAHTGITSVIATDHYAEATDYIIKFLKDLNLDAIALKDYKPNHEKAPIVVANSADIGTHKAELKFWEAIKLNLKLYEIQRILIIDDFGYNEQEEDSYSNRERVEKRKYATLNMLKQAFSATVEIIPFMKQGEYKEYDFAQMIENASTVIDRFMEKDNRHTDVIKAADGGLRKGGS